MTPTIALLMITHNRLEYTQKAVLQLRRIEIPFDLTIVDNVSTDGTMTYLSNLKRPHAKIEYLSEHQPLSVITNNFWRKSMDYDLVGKVDNDTLVSESWLQRLIEVHQASEHVAAVGGFAFDIYQDWNFENSKRNVRDLGKCKVLIQPIIGGCAYLTKPRVIEKVGFLDEDIRMEMVDIKGVSSVVLSSEKWGQEMNVITPESLRVIVHGWTEWQKVAQSRGYVVCYPFPLQVVDHMDDPLSAHCLLDKDRTCTELAKQNAKQRGIQYSRASINDWIRKDGRYLFTEYAYDGGVGERVYV
jgi:glycosyltransferase involved in cell wall biosynthesis